MMDTFERWYEGFRKDMEGQNPDDLTAAANMHFRQHICWEIDLLKARLSQLEERGDDA